MAARDSCPRAAACRVLGRKLRLSESQAIRSLPRRGLHELVEEFDGFRVVSGFFQQGGRRIEILVWIADHYDEAAQQIERAGGVPRREADFGQTEEVGGDQVVALDLAGEEEFENLACRLLVASFGDLAGCVT